MTIDIIQDLKERLRIGVVTVTFLKKDGSERIMNCTLNSDFLPEQVEGKYSKKPNDDVLNVWDIDIEGWRSFRINSILEFHTPSMALKAQNFI